MADAANKASIQADLRPPDYRAAVQRIRTIPAKKEKVASANGDIADIWAKVEGHKVDKHAGKAFLRLDDLDPEDRLRFMRDLNGLIDAAGWPETDSDLVDKAQGKVVQMRAGATGGDDDQGGGDDQGGSGGDDPNADDAGDDDNGPAPEPEPEVKAASKGPAADALAKARERIGSGGRKTGHAGAPLH